MKRITEYDNITTVAENDVVPIVDVSDTEQASTGSTRKGTIATIADYLKDRAETLTGKTLTSPVLNTADINTPDIDGGTIDDSTINGGSIGSGTDVTEVLKKVYPVGSIYINATVATNPATLLGFGTWTAFGAGKVMVGLDSTDTDFDTAEETGGAKTHTLTVAEMPEHKHTVSYGSSLGVLGVLAAADDTLGTNSSAFINNTGGSDAHNNLQPYIVVYMFKRTA
jgi:hypothetical protein